MKPAEECLATGYLWHIRDSSYIHVCHDDRLLNYLTRIEFNITPLKGEKSRNQPRNVSSRGGIALAYLGHPVHMCVSRLSPIKLSYTRRSHDPSHACPPAPPPPPPFPSCARMHSRVPAGPPPTRMCAPLRYLSPYIPLRLDSPPRLLLLEQRHVNNPLPPWPRLRYVCNRARTSMSPAKTGADLRCRVSSAESRRGCPNLIISMQMSRALTDPPPSLSH